MVTIVQIFKLYAVLPEILMKKSLTKNTLNALKHNNVTDCLPMRFYENTAR